MKAKKSFNFNEYKMKILKNLMEICLITGVEALLTIVNSEGKYIIFSSTKNSKIFIDKYLIKNHDYNISEKYNLKDVMIIYLIFLV